MNAYQAMSRDLNKEFSSLLGEKNNWFEMVVASCRKFLSGQDVYSLAGDVSARLILDFRADKIRDIFDKCKSCDRGKLFYRMSWLRARRLYVQYIHVCGTLACDVGGKSGGGDSEVSEICAKIFDKLKDDSYVLSVARVRLSNPGGFVGLGEIASQLNLKKGKRLSDALKKIQRVYRKVAG